MAITQNTFTGNGTTVLYSFSFPYLDQSHVKATLNGTPTTAFTFANATTLQFNSAPGAGVEIVIFRETDSDQAEAVFVAGSPIRAADLNQNNTQLLYVAQESSFTANEASTVAETALSQVSSSFVLANQALATANQAQLDATDAVNTSNQAQLDATAAVNTANAADLTSQGAVVTANAALVAVAAAVAYQPVADLAALALLTPSNAEFFELQDSTGADTDPSITGVPVGLVGVPGLTFRLRYDDPPGEYVFLGYFSNDSETRYFKVTGGSISGNVDVTGDLEVTGNFEITGDTDLIGTVVVTGDLEVTGDADFGDGTLVVNETDGRVGIGTDTPEATLDIVSQGTSNVRNALGRHYDNTTAFSQFKWIGGRARGNRANPSAVLNNDSLVSFNAKGYKATGWSNTVGGLYVYAAENWTDTATGTYITLRGAATGGTAVTEWARFTPTTASLPATVETTNLKNPSSGSAAITLDTSGNATAPSLVPPGTVQFYAASTAPAGWVKANGAQLSRSTYASLFAAIGTTFGAGDGSTTFNLPDLRGEFPRGWDDSRGLDSGRGFGSVQGQDYQSHTHGVTDPGHRHQQVYQRNQADHAVNGIVGDNGAFGDVLSFGTMQFSTTGISIQNSGASETRPRNIALLAIIKF
jgi:microcystin-dependent protein